jgi:hypothetical protein
MTQAELVQSIQIRDGMLFLALSKLQTDIPGYADADMLDESSRKGFYLHYCIAT